VSICSKHVCSPKHAIIKKKIQKIHDVLNKIYFTAIGGLGMLGKNIPNIETVSLKITELFIFL
jgi:hypothetical protein